MCKRIANRFLCDRRDVEECMNDVYLAVWNTIPPQRPNPLSTYIYRIVKNIVLKKYRINTAQKRNYNYDVILEELEDCVGVNETVENEILAQEISNEINVFLGQIKEKDCSCCRKCTGVQSFAFIISGYSCKTNVRKCQL